MANCIVNLLRAIWSFIIGSLRMILFFGCLLSLLIQIAHVYLLIRVTADGGRVEMPDGTVGLDDYGIAFGLLILSLVGCYGAFYRHHQSVKIVSISHHLPQCIAFSKELTSNTITSKNLSSQ